MARMKIRYLVEKAELFYWQPSARLVKLGWVPERLPDGRAAAIHRAEALNAQLDHWRKGTLPEPGAQLALVPRPSWPAGSVSELIARYKASRFYLDKRPKTQRAYTQNLKVIEAAIGGQPAIAISARVIEDLYVGMRVKTPSKARAVVVMLRMLLKHGVRDGMLNALPQVSPGTVGAKPSGILWPDAAVALLARHADLLGWHSLGTAIVVDHWIGQRQGDILALLRGQYRDGSFHVTQRKTEAKVAVPHSPAVAARVQAELARQDAHALPTAPLLVCETTKRAWKEDHFRHVFAAVRTAAAAETPALELPDGGRLKIAALQFMHLRHTAITKLAIAGATSVQISGVTGHTIKGVEAILERYLVRTSELAASATKLRLASDAAGEKGKGE